MSRRSRYPIILVTGLSGAGRSSAAHALEDLRFHCIDAVPGALLLDVVEHFSNSKSKTPLVIGLDLRTKTDVSSALKALDIIDAELVFLEATTEVIMSRYRQTRRRHPFSPANNQLNLVNAIDRERELLSPIAKQADCRIDTSYFSPNKLLRLLEQRYTFDKFKRKLSVLISSFGFKNGIDHTADLVFDVRFLDNPYYSDDLRHLDGRNLKIKKFIEKDKRSKKYFDQVIKLLEISIPYYFDEGKQTLRISFGCTGGKHRSVYMAEKVFSYFKRKKNSSLELEIEHKDL